MPVLLSCKCLRNGRSQRRPRWQADPPESFQLRSLQNLRHHGSLRNHHLGAARRRRRPELRRDVKMKTVRFLCFLSFLVAVAANAQKVEFAVVGGGMFSSNASSTGAVEGSLAYRFFGVPMASLYLELPIAAGLEK